MGFLINTCKCINVARQKSLAVHRWMYSFKSVFSTTVQSWITIFTGSDYVNIIPFIALKAKNQHWNQRNNEVLKNSIQQRPNYKQGTVDKIYTVLPCFFPSTLHDSEFSSLQHGDRVHFVPWNFFIPQIAFNHQCQVSVANSWNFLSLPVYKL